MEVTILGAGMAGLSAAYFLQDNKKISKINIVEKEKDIGGLCRSIRKDKYVYDIGPHIIFSKDEEVLAWIKTLISGNENKLKRSNKILYDGRYIQYPFENDLSKLSEMDLDYCLNAFNNNPYENYVATNMIQFFLKTFGEGITEIYLKPYNEKIWKFDLSFMNTQMVDRIPKPTSEEIQRSASGETIDGYLHQLYFTYPSEGGIGAIVDALSSKLNKKCNILTEQEVQHVEKKSERYHIKTNLGEIESDILISTIPIQELYGNYAEKQDNITVAIDSLKYNSIKIALVTTKEDLCGENFTFTIPDKNVIFHRISKMNFLGENYNKGETSFIVEITYRENDKYDRMEEREICTAIKDGMVTIGFAKDKADIRIVNITNHKYAYVIYDLLHSSNMELIRQYFNDSGIYLTGRFGNFEYWNMDRVIGEAKKTSEKILMNI